MEPKNLRKAGLKVTHPRKRILKILEDQQNRHLTADDIYRSLVEANEDIGLATVYRVLNQFESAGLVEKQTGFGSEYATPWYRPASPAETLLIVNVFVNAPDMPPPSESTTPSFSQ